MGSLAGSRAPAVTTRLLAKEGQKTWIVSARLALVHAGNPAHQNRNTAIIPIKPMASTARLMMGVERGSVMNFTHFKCLFDALDARKGTGTEIAVVKVNPRMATVNGQNSSVTLANAVPSNAITFADILSVHYDGRYRQHQVGVVFVGTDKHFTVTVLIVLHDSANADDIAFAKLAHSQTP